MSYPNRLGEFVVSTQDDWPKTIQFNERPPVKLRGALNPWELERIRTVWMKEKEAWSKIQPLQREYRAIEKKMEQDISIFNSHLKELERVTKKKTGLGPIGSYGGMALAVLPGFGWFSAAFSIISMGIEMIGGNKKKKRVNELMHIMEMAQARLQKNQQRLISIQEELKSLLQVTEIAKNAIQQMKEYHEASSRIALQEKQAIEERQAQSISLEKHRIRQLSPKRVYSDTSL